MDFLGDVLGDIVADQAGKAVRRVRRRFGPAPSGAGCALKIVSGSQDGLSQHWRRGEAQFAPGELRFAQHGTTRPPITVLGAHETTGRVSLPSLGDCFIAQLRTPTSTLDLAMGREPLGLAVHELTRSPGPAGTLK
jgi:hypothetical protein